MIREHYGSGLELVEGRAGTTLGSILEMVGTRISVSGTT